MKLLLTLGLASAAVASAKECVDWNADPKGLTYDGSQSQALSWSKKPDRYEHNKKVDCQNWSASYPNNNNVGYNENHNYCRNPDGDANGPWCFLSDISQTWYTDKRNGRRYRFPRNQTPFARNYGLCKDLIPQCKNNNPAFESLPDPRGGCYSSENVNAEKTLNMPHFTEPDNREWCKSQCQSAGFAYAGAETPKFTFMGRPQDARVCKCFNSYKNTPSNQCNRWCQDYKQNKFCGGEKSMNIWKV